MKRSTFALPLSLITLATIVSTAAVAEPVRTGQESPANSEEVLESRSDRDPSESNRSGDIQANSSTSDQEATLTCYDGYLACFTVEAFCHNNGGGLSSNADGGFTCSY